MGSFVGELEGELLDGELLVVELDMEFSVVGLLEGELVLDLLELFTTLFNSVFKEFSEDPGSASRGGDLDWLSRGKTAPAFEKMMLESPVGEISPVFQSEFGFHFLEVLDTRTEDLTEEVIKDRAYGILFARKFDEELENFHYLGTTLVFCGVSLAKKKNVKKF